MKKIELAEIFRVEFIQKCTFKAELSPVEMQGLAGDIQNWLFTKKGILAEIKIK